MKALISGTGSIGRRHARNLLALGHEVVGHDTDPARAARAADELGAPVHVEVSDALAAGCDAAFVCTPTSLHVPTATAFAEAGLHLFIEKPLAADLEGVEDLARTVEERDLVAFVACNMRFLPSLERVRTLIGEGAVGRVCSARISCGYHLPYWHPAEDYRTGYSANRELGGGAILDDIHEIDFAVWILGPVAEVFCLADTVSGLEIDTEDLAEITLRHTSGAVSQIHLDYLQRTYRRGYEFIGERGVIVWDYRDLSVKVFGESQDTCVVYEESINASRETMFLEQTRHFVRCVEEDESPVNDVRGAAGVLRVALACHESARRKAVVRP